MTRVFRRGLVALVALSAAGSMAACHDGGATGPTPGPPISSDVLKTVLDEALQDAYRTQFTYERIVADQGPMTPFTMLASAEKANASAIVNLYSAWNVTAPASAWNTSNVPRYAGLQQACVAAEEGEQATQMMFDRLLALNLPDDVRSAFEAMRSNARSQHWSSVGSCAGGAPAPVSALVAASIVEALQAEYRLFYTKARILIDLGNVAPFANTRDAEWQHVGAAANLFASRGLTVPASSSTSANVPRFGTLQQACAAGVDAAFENAMMYDRLRLQDLPTDVGRVFANLRSASLQQIAALQHCAGGATPGVSADVLAAMGLVLRDELVQQWTYYFIIEDVPADFPFTIMNDAEETNVMAIENLYVKRSLAVPQPGLVIPAYHSMSAACNAAIASETAMVGTYDHVLSLALPDDIKQLMVTLRAATQDRHLPAFRACGTT